MPPARRILYIAGSGRSGSTLLARMLGQIEGTCSVGELRHIWRTGATRLSADELCGCGLPYSQCAFWRAVIERAGEAGSSLDAGLLLRLKERVDRVRYIPWMLSRRRPAGYSRRLGEYSATVANLYDAIGEVSGASVIVDASKDPSTLYLLTTIETLSVTVIHLVRDARGVAFAWKKRKLRPEFPGREVYMQRHGSLKSAGFWLYGNLLAQLSRRRYAGYLQVRYEDLVREPVAWLEKICAIAGLEPDLGFVNGDRVTLEKPSHTLSGNPSRFTGGEVTLRCDEAWRAGMPARHRAAVNALAFPLLLRYGYYRPDRPGHAATPPSE